jgi:lipopolysaccharide/colanic/teichoic acid biosynthesis glycosyltransferase
LWVLAPFRESLSPRYFAGFGRVTTGILIVYFVMDLVGSSLSATAVAAMIGAVVFERALLQYVWVSARRRGRLQRATLVVGRGPIAEALVSTLRAHPEYGGRHVHRPELLRGNRNGARRADAHCAGRLPEASGVRLAFVVDGEGPLPMLDPRCDVYLALANDSPLAMLADDHVWGIPVMRVPRPRLAGPARSAKRAVDVVGALFAIVITSPLLVLSALAVRLSGPGGIIFRQSRIGKDGRRITVSKFRTMREGRELNLELIDGATAHDWQCWQHDEARSRETPVGRFLRATSLDELPQFFDVLRGDLSLVGPRPELPDNVQHYSLDITGYADRHRMPAGLTGWAQIHGLRGETSLRERAQFDNYYIETWSLGRDVVIIVATFAALVRHALRMLSKDSGGDGPA